MAVKEIGANGGRPADNPLLRPRYTRWLVFVLLLVAIINFADRAILAVLAQPIKEDLHLTDTDLGVLQGLGFAILYSMLGIPLGMYAERTVRTRMLAVCLAAWSLMTMACGLAGSFAMLLLGRIGVGVGEAGAQPVSSSLIADHVAPAKRGSMLAIILLGAPFGFLLGQSVGGIIAGEWGWRAAFYAMGIPGLAVALLVLWTLREPPRGLAEGASAAGAASPPSFRQVVRFLWGKRTFRHLLAGFVLGGFALNAIANFALPFFLRGFGLPLATMGVLFGAMSFLSNGVGMLLGGFGVDRLARHDRRWSMWAPAIALLACIPLYAGAFLSSSIHLSLGFMALGNLALAMHMAPTSATMQNMVGPRMRATTTAIVALVVGVLSAGLGPTIAGMLSDRFAADGFATGDFFVQCPGGRGGDGAGTALDLACLAASTDGLRLAMLSILGFFAWAALHYWFAGKHLEGDLYQPE
jgi:predicted MFS family arabinose efflux permease